MDAYKMLIVPEGDEVDKKTVGMRECIICMMSRAGDLHNTNHHDITSRIRTELVIGKIVYKSNVDHAGEAYTPMFDLYDTFSNDEHRNLFACLRDICDGNIEDIAKCVGTDTEIKDIEVILDDYLKTMVQLDDISPEVSDEIERLYNMTDEEFDEEMNKSDSEDEEEDEDYPEAPDTTEYNPDYDIPDEKLYKEE